jgi:hypothetical protein
MRRGEPTAADAYLDSAVSANPNDVFMGRQRYDATSAPAASGSASLSFAGVITAAGEAQQGAPAETVEFGGHFADRGSSFTRRKKTDRERAEETLRDILEALGDRPQDLPAAVVEPVRAIVAPRALSMPAPSQINWAEIAFQREAIAELRAAVADVLIAIRAQQEEDDEDVMLLAA